MSDRETAEDTAWGENKLLTVVTRQIDKLPKSIHKMKTNYPPLSHVRSKKNVEDTAQSENKLPTTVTRQIDK